MNNWLEYAVPKKYARLYYSHIGKNVLILLLIMMFVFEKFPSAISLYFVIFLSDAAFYHAMKRVK